MMNVSIIAIIMTITMINVIVISGTAENVVKLLEIITIRRNRL